MPEIFIQNSSKVIPLWTVKRLACFNAHNYARSCTQAVRNSMFLRNINIYHYMQFTNLKTTLWPITGAWINYYLEVHDCLKKVLAMIK